MTDRRARDVHGHCANGFEAVAQELAAAGARLAPGGCAFAAYVEGEQVVDVWTGDAAPGRPWSSDTLAILFSSSKGLTATAAQVLVDRGELDVDAFVGDYWPEFATNGKEKTLVRHILGHTAGVTSAPGWWDVFGWDGKGLDRSDDIAALLAAAAPEWEPGTAHGYHGITFGWLVGELVRRITGSNLGAFFAETVADPLGLDIHIGTTSDDRRRVAALCGRMDPPEDAPRQLLDVWKLWHDPSTLAGRAMMSRPEGNLFDHMGEFIQSAHTLGADFGSGGATGTAASLARMYAALGEGGTLDGVTISSPSTVARFATEEASGIDLVAQVPWRWGLGYQLQPPGAVGDIAVLGPFGKGAPHAFGHCGFGGQIAGVDPDRRYAFAFVRSNIDLGAGSVGMRIVDTAAACLS